MLTCERHMFFVRSTSREITQGKRYQQGQEGRNRTFTTSGIDNLQSNSTMSLFLMCYQLD
jgi:hypothetical protein